MTRLRIILAGVLTVALLIAASLAVQRYYGRASRNIDAANRRAGYEQQQTLRSIIDRKLTEHAALPDGPQKTALRNELCGLIGRINGGASPATHTFEQEHCQ